jgi:hypothetical protein
LAETLLDAASDRVSIQLDAGRWAELEAFDVRSSSGAFVMSSADGDEPIDFGGLRLWRGHLRGDPDSQVFIGVSSHAMNGWFRQGDDLRILSSGGGPAETAAWTAALDLPAATLQAPACEVRVVEGQTPVRRDHRGEGEPPCRAAMLAIDSDWEFTDRIFGGSAGAAAAYAVTLAAGVSEIYRENINVRFEVTFLRVWSDDSDPYDPTSPVDMLDQFRGAWDNEMSDVERHVAHMLTGRTNLPYGGVAWLSVLCNTSYGYGVSGYLSGSFPYPLQDNHSGNWDLVVMAHELGHNFGTMHTHDGYSPPIDNCGNGNCDGAEDGTIMSYCHTCAGGIANIRLGFHVRVQDVILGYLDAIEPGCEFAAGTGSAQDDWAQAIAGETIELDVLANDAASDCEGGFEPVIASFDETTLAGGSVSLVPGSGGDLDRLAYTPSDGYDGEDAFGYELVGGSTATVFLTVEGMRPADQPESVQPGASADYFALDAPSSLPDFTVLTPYLDDVVPNIGFQSTAGAFATSGRSDEVGAVFTGYVDVAESGFYTLSVESDDGSRLYVGDDLLVDNDGEHAMTERAGTIGLMAGQHAVRVEFFEHLGGAGLVVRYEGPGLARQIIPEEAWTHEVEPSPCPEDVNGDGVIGVADLLQVIGTWGPCQGCASDVDGSGDVDVGDLLAVIAAWDTPC